jgi:hypothetical protein
VIAVIHEAADIITTPGVVNHARQEPWFQTIHVQRITQAVAIVPKMIRLDRGRSDRDGWMAASLSARGGTDRVDGDLLLYASSHTRRPAKNRYRAIDSAMPPAQSTLADVPSRWLGTQVITAYPTAIASPGTTPQIRGMTLAGPVAAPCVLGLYT